jgi:hypothetical protein
MAKLRAQRERERDRGLTWAWNMGYRRKDVYEMNDGGGSNKVPERPHQRIHA